MIDNTNSAMDRLMENELTDPEEIWNRLGIDIEVATDIAQVASRTFGCDDPAVILTIMELGACLAELGMRELQLTE